MSLEEHIEQLVKALVAEQVKEQVTGQVIYKTVLTLEEAAAYTGLSKSRLYALVSERKIPHYKQGKLYFKKKELDDWLTAHRVATKKEIQSKAMMYCCEHPMPVAASN